MLHRFRELLQEQDREREPATSWALEAFVIVPIPNASCAWLVAIYHNAWEHAQLEHTGAADDNWRWN